ncbi:DNA repair protein rad2 [Ordospora colligata]|uniref:DNA repair flap endonuclease n=1 Tax=Ordospora colligata OC4 TaxID=1354746 RepID=A0A0B2UD32_9MICR|nr:DNA repair flap endonuclease [Ordospora colligata OC4]KHN68981.1 DNA repair flap endonuclease [Ordospora colligata OC4]TBU14204.1 DNA repair flap endonuclease [Ordospora colligata]TBU14256.1 DNA repair flap endonuclease [Ordospora colligata]
MGVRSLWKIIQRSGEKVVPSNMRLAVDTSIWLGAYWHLRNEDVIYFFSMRVVKLLYHGIQPVFVFDGNAPEVKRQALRERQGTIDDSVKYLEMKLIDKEGQELAFDPNNIFDEKYMEKWGDAFDDMPDDVSEELNCKNEAMTFSNTSDEYDQIPGRYDDINDKMTSSDSESEIDFGFVESKEISRMQKLRRLVDLRVNRRKIRTKKDYGSMEVFSAQQIKNLKKRNFISQSIRNMEVNQAKIVQSDCKVVYGLTKKVRYGTIDNKEEKASAEEIKYNQLCSIDAHEVDEWIDSDTEMHKDHEEKHHDAGHIESGLIINELTSRHGYFDNVSFEESIQKVDGLLSIQKDKVNEMIVKCKGERSMGGFFADSEFGDHEKLQDFRKVLKPIGCSDRIIHLHKMNRVIEQVKKVLLEFNIAYVDSPMESDSQCGFMSLSNMVDGVITEDNDVLLYGGVVFRHFFRKNRDIERYSLDRIEQKVGLNRKELVMLSYLLGSDYTPGIKGFGPVKALECVRNDGVDEEKIAMLLGMYLNPIAASSVEITRPKVDLKRLEKFYEQNGVTRERIDEILFFLRNKRWVYD